MSEGCNRGCEHAGSLPGSAHPLNSALGAQQGVQKEQRGKGEKGKGGEEEEQTGRLVQEVQI